MRAEERRKRDREYARAFRAAHPRTESDADRDRRYYEANRETILVKARRRYEADPTIARESARQYRADNLEKVRERERRYREANKEKQREYDRQRRLADPEKIRAYDRARYAANREKKLRATRERYDALRVFTNWLKLLPCSDCERTFPTEHMEFDHRDPTEKAWSVSAMFRQSPEVVQAELTKCDVVCHGCHMIRTANWRAAKRGELAA